MPLTRTRLRISWIVQRSLVPRSEKVILRSSLHFLAYDLLVRVVLEWNGRTCLLRARSVPSSTTMEQAVLDFKLAMEWQLMPSALLSPCCPRFEPCCDPSCNFQRKSILVIREVGCFEVSLKRYGSSASDNVVAAVTTYLIAGTDIGIHVLSPNIHSVQLSHAAVNDSTLIEPPSA